MASETSWPEGPPSFSLSRYFDACATSPPAPEVLRAMAEAHAQAWANPSSLHGHGLAAAERLERSRLLLAELLGCAPQEVILGSGGSEAIHTALLGATAGLEPGRVVISAVEHPATLAAVAELERRGWRRAVLPVDRQGFVRPETLAEVLEPPTRLVSLIWGQSEVGSLQPIQTLGDLCRAAGVLLHVDAVQVAGQLPIAFSRLPVDLLSCAAHKLQGPRGVGALLLRQGVTLAPLIGGAQEGGRRGGTEAVALAAGFAEALALRRALLRGPAGHDPVAALRDRLWEAIRRIPGVWLTGADPGAARGSGEPRRLPHHLSLLVAGPDGTPLPGRALVRALGREGYAVSSGSACRSAPGQGTEGGASPVLRAMGYDERKAAGGLRISLGPWVEQEAVDAFPAALERARARVAAG